MRVGVSLGGRVPNRILLYDRAKHHPSVQSVVGSLFLLLPDRLPSRRLGRYGLCIPHLGDGVLQDFFM